MEVRNQTRLKLFKKLRKKGEGKKKESDETECYFSPLFSLFFLHDLNSLPHGCECDNEHLPTVLGALFFSANFSHPHVVINWKKQLVGYSFSTLFTLNLHCFADKQNPSECVYQF